MKIEYDKHYNQEYWSGKKQYREADGKVSNYGGPSLDWDGWEVIADTLSALLMPGSLLDVGCGGAGLTRRMLARGFDAYGVDVSQHAIDRAPASLKARLALADVCDKSLVLPFPDVFFDNIVATDFMEHIYEEDLDYVLNWLKARGKRFFFLVATGHDPSRPDSFRHPTEFVLKKGEEVPVGYEGVAVAGHVNVRPFSYWVMKFATYGFKIRWDLMYAFQMAREFDPGWRVTWGWQMAATFFLEVK